MFIGHFSLAFGGKKIKNPPSINAVAWSANLMWIIVFWAWWIEND